MKLGVTIISTEERAVTRNVCTMFKEVHFENLFRCWTLCWVGCWLYNNYTTNLSLYMNKYSSTRRSLLNTFLSSAPATNNKKGQPICCRGVLVLVWQGRPTVNLAPPPPVCYSCEFTRNINIQLSIIWYFIIYFRLSGLRYTACNECKETSAFLL